MLSTLINAVVSKSLMVTQVKVVNTDTSFQIFSHIIFNAGVVICQSLNKLTKLVIIEEFLSQINVVSILKVLMVVLGVKKSMAGEAVDVQDSIPIGSPSTVALLETVPTASTTSETASVMISDIQKLHGVLSQKFTSNVLQLLLLSSQLRLL